MNAKELHDLLLTRNPPDLASFCAGHETILRALRLLAAAEANDGSENLADVMEVVSLVEDIVTAARLTQFYEDPIYKPWSEQVWRSVDTARKTITTRRKALERIAEERNGLAARVRELEPDAERFTTLKEMFDYGGVTIRLIGEVDKLGMPLVTHEYTEWEPLQSAIDAARSK